MNGCRDRARSTGRVVEAQATERLGEFLAVRMAGKGAEGLVQVDLDVDVPGITSAAGSASNSSTQSPTTPEERFDNVIAETEPIIESIEFHPPGAVTFVSRQPL